MVRVSRTAMGTNYEALLVGTDRDYLEAAGHQALDEVERLDDRLSHYNPASEVCDLNARAAHEPVLLEPGFLSLLQRAVALSEATGGAFDCTAGPLVKCWGFFRGEGRLPEPGEIQSALERVGSRWIELDGAARTARFRREGLEVHLGGIGKGYAVDQAVQILRELGVEAALVHGGGSTLYALGAPPGQDGWDVGLRDPRDRAGRLGVVRLRDRALSTSGDYEQYFETGGRRYSHILDPRTGYPAEGVQSAVVLADTATDTDALSTAAFVLGIDATRELFAECPELGAVIVPDCGAESTPTMAVIGSIDWAPADGVVEDR